MTSQKQHFVTQSIITAVSLLVLIGLVSCRQTPPTTTTPEEPTKVQLLTADNIRTVVQNFSNTVAVQDTSLLAQSVAENFAVATVTWPASRRYMQQIFTQTPAIDSIVPLPASIMAVENSFKQKVAANIYLKDKKTLKTTITLDGRTNKIIYVDYLDSLFGVFRNKPAQLVSVIPIDTAGQFIIVHLKLNKYDKSLRFLFDSGADGMAVSKELATKIGLKVNKTQSTSVVGGNMNIQISNNNILHLDTLTIPNQNIAVFDAMKENIDGIIGLSLAKKFIIKVDFDALKMYLYSFGPHTYEELGETVPVTVPGGVAIIPGYLNLTGKDTVSGRFVFDSGAGYYFMGYSPFVSKNKLLLSGFKPESQAFTVSMGHSTPVFNGTAKEFSIGKSIKMTDMPVSLQASATGNDNWNPGADASLGIKFIDHYNFTINLLEKEIHFTPRTAQ